MLIGIQDSIQAKFHESDFQNLGSFDILIEHCHLINQIRVCVLNNIFVFSFILQCDL